MTPGRTLWSREQKVDNYANVATGERAGSGAGMCDDGPGDIFMEHPVFISHGTWRTLWWPQPFRVYVLNYMYNIDLCPPTSCSSLSCYNCYWGQMSVIFCYLSIFPSFRELVSAGAEQSKWIIFNFLRLSRKWWKTIIKWFPRKYFLAFSVELNSKWCQWD